MSETIFETCPLAGVILFRPAVHGDARGYFREISRRDAYAAAGADSAIIRQNSISNDFLNMIKHKLPE